MPSPALLWASLGVFPPGKGVTLLGAEAFGPEERATKRHPPSFVRQLAKSASLGYDCVQIQQMSLRNRSGLVL